MTSKTFNLDKPFITVLLVIIIFFLSHVFFIQLFDIWSDEFFNNYKYLLLFNILINFFSIFFISDKSIKLVFILYCIGLVIFLVLFEILVTYMAVFISVLSYA